MSPQVASGESDNSPEGIKNPLDIRDSRNTMSVDCSKYKRPITTLAHTGSSSLISDSKAYSSGTIGKG
jgi:hypothetical protein